MDPLWRLEFGRLWKAFRREPVSFWFACAYVVLEYVRPQLIYPAIDVLPWAQLAILGALAAVLIERGRVSFSTPITAGVLIYAVIVLVSSITAWSPPRAWRDIDVFISWVVIYLIIVNSVTTERRYFFFLGVFLLSSFKMSQSATRQWAAIGFQFRDWGVAGAPGTFSNSGEFGIQMCVFLPLAIYFALALRPYLRGWKYALVWLMPATAVVGAIASSSRGALVGTALVVAWMVSRSRYRLRAGLAALVIALVVYALVPDESRVRFTEAGQDYESVHRLTIWKYGIGMANERPVLGVGYRNFDVYVDYYSRGQMYGSLLPHNIFIEAWAELGYLGLAAFLSLIALTFVTNRRTRGLARRMGERGRFLWHAACGLDGALVGFIGSGFFVTVLYYPYFWINLAMTAALHVAARDLSRRLAADPYVAPRSVGRPGTRHSGRAILSKG